VGGARPPHQNPPLLPFATEILNEPISLSGIHVSVIIEGEKDEDRDHKFQFAFPGARL
jgi:hypothetical protein